MSDVIEVITVEGPAADITLTEKVLALTDKLIQVERRLNRYAEDVAQWDNIEIDDLIYNMEREA